MRLAPLNALRAFEAVARHLSVTKAAYELCVTHAAVSQQIKVLEKYLNMKLIYRQSNQTYLTEKGKQYATIINSCFLQLKQATEHLLTPSEPNILTVYLPATLAMRWFIPRMQYFQEKYPDIKLRLVTGQDKQDFMQAGADIAIICTNMVPRDFQYELLLEDFILPMAHPSMVIGKNKKDIVDYFTTYKCIYITAPLRKNDWAMWLAAAELAEPKKANRIYFESTLQAIYAAVNGVGILMAHELLVEDALKMKHLIKLSNLKIKTAYNYYLVHPKEYTRMEKVKLFKRWLLQELNKSV